MFRVDSKPNRHGRNDTCQSLIDQANCGFPFPREVIEGFLSRSPSGIDFLYLAYVYRLSQQLFLAPRGTSFQVCNIARSCGRLKDRTYDLLNLAYSCDLQELFNGRIQTDLISEQTDVTLCPIFQRFHMS